MAHAAHLDLPALESWFRKSDCRRYFSAGEQAEVFPLDEAVVELREAGKVFENTNHELEKVLKKPGLNL